MCQLLSNPYIAALLLLAFVVSVYGLSCALAYISVLIEELKSPGLRKTLRTLGYAVLIIAVYFIFVWVCKVS